MVDPQYLSINITYSIARRVQASSGTTNYLKKVGISTINNHQRSNGSYCKKHVIQNQQLYSRTNTHTAILMRDKKEYMLDVKINETENERHTKKSLSHADVCCIFKCAKNPRLDISHAYIVGATRLDHYFLIFIFAMASCDPNAG